MHRYDTFIYLEVYMGDINTIQSIEVSAVHRRLNVNELYLFLYSIELVICLDQLSSALRYANTSK